ncbi:hypothetical protein [Mucilaginibacter sp.]|jgi:hypothetical protein|uniref:hypothetical protein n=1 Tax=Mucilaginibacter sp. TaxID=1882438 RepID=UPI0035699416
MGQLLRITYGAKDYSYQLLNEKPIGKETEQITMLLEGRSLRLIRRDGQWLSPEVVHGIDEGLLNAIGKAISLRYRI